MMSKPEEKKMDYQIDLSEYFKNSSAIDLARTIDTAIKENIAIADVSFLSFYDQELHCLRYRDALIQELRLLNYYEGKLKKYKTDLENFNLLLNPSLQKKLIIMYTEWQHTQKELYSENGRRLYHLGRNIDVESFYLEEATQINKLIPLTTFSLSRAKILLAQRKDWEIRLKNRGPKPPKMSSDVLSILSKSKPIPTIIKDPKHDIELLSEIGIESLKQIIYAIARTWNTSNYEELKVIILFNITHWCNSNTKGDGGFRKQSCQTSSQSVTDLKKKYQTLFYKLKNQMTLE